MSVLLFPVSVLIFECVIAPFIGIEDLSGQIPLYYFIEQLFEGISIVLTGRCITCLFWSKLHSHRIVDHVPNHTIQYLLLQTSDLLTLYCISICISIGDITWTIRH